MTAPSWNFSAREAWVLLAGVALHLLLGTRAIIAQSPTYDEPLHLAAGISYWRTGDQGLNAHCHPPLPSLLAALPALALGADVPLDSPLWKEKDWAMGTGKQYAFANEVVYRNPSGVPGDRLIRAGRAGVLALSLLLPLLLLAAGRRLFGPAAGWTAFFLGTLCPSLLANGSLITTDFTLALFFFAAFLAWSEWDRTASRRWAAATGALLGLALCSKYTAYAMLPFVPLWAILRRKTDAARPGNLLAFGGSLLAVVLAVYGPSNLHLLIEGLRNTVEIMGRGRRSFFFGRVYEGRCWLYFPAAFSLKTSLPVLAGAAAAAVLAARGRLKLPWPLWAPPAAYLLLACAATVQIGHRHILPLYPFLYVAIGGAAQRFWEMKARPIGASRAGAAAFGLWLLVSAVRADPYPLAYFNEAAGGPDRGHRFLADSNVDWGQGLKALRTYLDGEGIEDFYFNYFGSVDPREYGLRFLDVASINPAPGDTPDADPRGEKKALLVVSATNLRGTYYKDPAIFAWLQAFPPEATLARSLLVYDVTGNPAVHRWLSGYFRHTGRPAAAEREARWAAALEERASP